MAFGSPVSHSISQTVIGEALYYKGRIEESRAAYERAAQLNGKNTLAYFGLLRVLLRNNNTEGAKAKLGMIQAIDPDSFEIPYALALCAAVEGRSDEAIKYLQESIDKFPLLKNDLRDEPLLVSLGQDPRFVSLAKKSLTPNPISVAFYVVFGLCCGHIWGIYVLSFTYFSIAPKSSKPEASTCIHHDRIHP